MTTFRDIWNEDTTLTAEEKEEIKVRVELISQVISARNEKGISQRELEEISGVRQPVIARLEAGDTDPKLSTVIRVLKPLGYTIAVVPEEKAQ